MEKRIVKNIEFSKAVAVADIIEYQDGKVISMTFAQNAAVSITLFAFSKGEEISTHESSGDAIVHILDGVAKVTIGEDKINAAKGQIVVMPANIPHSIDAIENFKMLLTVVK